LKIIGISGGTGSGKTVFAKQLSLKLGKNKSLIVSMDNYYRNFGSIPFNERIKLNYDHPDTIDYELLIAHLNLLKANHPINMPKYSFTRCKRLKSSLTCYPKQYIILEGILVFSNPLLNNFFDLRIFLDIDSETRLKRIIERDINNRGFSKNGVIRRFIEKSEPMQVKFIEPYKTFSDFIISEDTFDSTIDKIVYQFI
jgi:uridine kinase